MIHLFALLSLLLCGVCYTGFQNSSHFRNTGSRRSLLLLLYLEVPSAPARSAYTTHGFSNDIACFAAWADRIFTLGPKAVLFCRDVYGLSARFHVCIVSDRTLRSSLQIPYYSDLHILLLKLPAILCDIACGFLLYREAVRRLHFSDLQGIFAASGVSLFQPVIHLEFFLLGTGGFRIHPDDHPHVPVPHEPAPAYAVYGLECPVKATDADLHAGTAGRIWDHVFLQDFPGGNSSIICAVVSVVICGCSFCALLSD